MGRPVITPVVIESPFAGDIDRNTRYARALMLDSLRRGEAPFLSHLLYTQVLHDPNPEERELGIEAGLAIARLCRYAVIGMDLGISPGMKRALGLYAEIGMPIVWRTLGGFVLTKK